MSHSLFDILRQFVVNCLTVVPTAAVLGEDVALLFGLS